MPEPKPGDRIRTTVPCSSFYPLGAFATLTRKDEDDCWWATFTAGRPGEWCVGHFPDEFEVVEPQWTDDEIRKWWVANGGEFFGPNVEHACMKEAIFLPLMRRLLLQLPMKEA